MIYDCIEQVCILIKELLMAYNLQIGNLVSFSSRHNFTSGRNSSNVTKP